MLFIRSSSQQSTTLIITHHKYRILQELQEVKYITNMDTIVLKPKH